MTQLVFFLEEPSAKEMLQAVLPRLLPQGVEAQFIVFEGKQSMEKRLPLRLRAWQVPGARFIVLRDQDSADCHAVKRGLAKLCAGAGHAGALVRIACHELESFYLGDLAAVGIALGQPGIVRQQDNHKYRQPDALGNAAEELRKLTALRYQKLAGSRAIAPHLRLDGSNRSRSFNVLIEGIRRMAAE